MQVLEEISRVEKKIKIPTASWPAKFDSPTKRSLQYRILWNNKKEVHCDCYINKVVTPLCVYLDLTQRLYKYKSPITGEEHIITTTNTKKYATILPPHAQSMLEQMGVLCACLSVGCSLSFPLSFVNGPHEFSQLDLIFLFFSARDTL